MSFHVSNKIAYSMETSFTHYTLIFSLVFILLNHQAMAVFTIKLNEYFLDTFIEVVDDLTN